jgi:hypothetical protein
MRRGQEAWRRLLTADGFVIMAAGEVGVAASHAAPG